MSLSDVSSSRHPATSILGVVDRIIVWLCKAVILVSGVALLCAISISVVARYVVSVGGVTWAEELPKQCFVWFIMAGVVLAVQRGSHIAVDLLLTGLPRPARRILIVVINVTVAAAYLYLTATTLEVASITAAEINPVLGTPGSLPFYALAIGLVLVAISSASIAIRIALEGPDAAPDGRLEDSVQ